jgi:hypothetical protein
VKYSVKQLTKQINAYDCMWALNQGISSVTSLYVRAGRARDEALGAVDAARRAAATAAERLRRLTDKRDAVHRANTALDTATRRWRERQQRADDWREKATSQAMAAVNARNKALAECETARAKCKEAAELRASTSAALVDAAERAGLRLEETTRNATALETEARCAAERAERFVLVSESRDLALYTASGYHGGQRHQSDSSGWNVEKNHSEECPISKVPQVVAIYAFDSILTLFHCVNLLALRFLIKVNLAGTRN